MSLPPAESHSQNQLTGRAPLRDDASFAAGKIAVFQYSCVVIFLFLISGFFKLQVQNPEMYDERAQQNSIKSVPLLAPRGRILDRDGRVIVDNRSSFSLILAREILKEEHLAPIAQGLDLDYSDLVAKVRKFRKQPTYVPIVLKEELTPADLAFVDSHRDFFPELVKIEAQRRLYPQNGMLAHVIGYTGEISESELDLPEFAKSNPGDVVGKFGIEKQYNAMLTGVDGQRQVIVDNRGRVREELAVKPYVAGKDLQLTIDLDLQVVAELSMDAAFREKEVDVDTKNGALVALDPRTGEVLAMVSRPAFDPNKFAVRIRSKDWKEIVDNPDNPLMNRAIQAQQAPGSTFKPFVALAGLESGAVDENFSVHCTGVLNLYGTPQRCHSVHGTVSMHRAIAQSCDSYFYTIGAKMGIDNISFYGDMAGFGRATGIDLPHENIGLMPSQKWKMRTMREKWYAGETPSVAIGQGAVTVTPIQLARAIGGVARAGEWYKPHLVLDAPKQDPVRWTLNPESVKAVIDGMYGVVNEGGTGVRARLPNIEVCGKTGSAQLASNKILKGTALGRAKHMQDNAWFEAFAPRNNPEIVVVGFFEHGVHGNFAAPMVRDVIKAYFDKKARLLTLQQEKQALQARAAALSPNLTPAPPPQAVESNR